LKEELINNISFIVVAKNEDFAITKCLSSLISLPLENCEIICVDSNSSDSTFEIMKRYEQKYPMVQVHQITGNVNSAIARNVGIKNIKKKFAFFIDGDVSINREFIVKALNYFKEGKADIITGKLEEIYYSDDNREIIRKVDDRFSINKECQIYYSGGSFMAKSKIVFEVGLFDEKFVRNQDIEYTMRLTRKGTFLAIPIKMGTHHTLEYGLKTFDYLVKLYPMYFGMIIRRNILYPKSILSLLINNLGFVKGIIFNCLLVILAVCAFFLEISIIWVVIPFLIILTIDLIFGLYKHQSVLQRFIGHYTYSLIIIAGIFFNKN
jgi:glycosyltransferase involved in cell wall biosynthesis